MKKHVCKFLLYLSLFLFLVLFSSFNVSAETRVKISLSSQKTNPEIARPNLPSTGEQVTILLSIIGIILVIMVLVVFQKRRKKQKEEKG